MISQNLKEFSKNNIIQKEERVRIVSFNKSKLLFEREEEINNYLKNEQAEDVKILKFDATSDTEPYVLLYYTRYQQYELTDDGYKATGIFHNKDTYEVWRAQNMLATSMDVL